MNKNRIIRDMVKEIRRLRGELYQAYEQMEYAKSAAWRSNKRAEEARLDARYAAEEAERVRQEAEDNRYERDRLMKDLDRARTWGNDWDEQRVLDKLKRL